MKQLFFLLLLSTGIAHSQNIKIDKLTGDTMWHSGFEKLYSKVSFSGTVGEQLKVIASKDKNGIKMGVWVQTAKSLTFSIDDMMQVKLSDGSIIDLKPAGSGAENIAYNFTGSSSITLFQLDSITITKLISNAVTFVRLTGSGRSLDYEIKDKFQRVISDCLKKVI